MMRILISNANLLWLGTVCSIFGTDSLIWNRWGMLNSRKFEKKSDDIWAQGHRVEMLNGAVEINKWNLSKHCFYRDESIVSSPRENLQESKSRLQKPNTRTGIFSFDFFLIRFLVGFKVIIIPINVSSSLSHNSNPQYFNSRHENPFILRML